MVLTPSDWNATTVTLISTPMLIARYRGAKTDSLTPPVWGSADSPRRRGRLGEPRQVRAPRRLGVADRAAAERAHERPCRPVAVRSAGQADAGPVALLAREEIEHRPAQQRRVAPSGRER